MRKVIYFIMMTAVLSIGFLYNLGKSGSEERLQSLHRIIGNKLMRIKKEHPQSQSLVYSVLDELGRYHSISKDIIAQKRKYRQLFDVEQKTAQSLQKELEKNKEKVEKMKKLIIEASDKLKRDFVAANELKEQKEIFEREKEEFLKEKELFELEKQQFTTERDSFLQNKDALIHEKGPSKKGGREPKPQPAYAKIEVPPQAALTS